MLTEVEGTQQDIEAQQIGKYKPYVLRQPEMIGIHSLRQQIGRAIRWCHLVSRHTAKEGICPTAALTRLLQIFDTLLTSTASCRGIVTIENAPLDVGREEIGEGQDGKQQHCQNIRQAFL